MPSIELKGGKIYSETRSNPYELKTREDIVDFIRRERLSLLLPPRINDLVEHGLPMDNLDTLLMEAIKSVEKDDGVKIVDIPHHLPQLQKIIVRFCELLGQSGDEKFNLSPMPQRRS
jgi:hypothetical protein